MSKSLPSELSDMIKTFFPLDEKTIIGHKCGLCGDFNPKLCYRCRITELETDNDNLRSQLKMGTTSLLLSHKELYFVNNYVICRSEEPQVEHVNHDFDPQDSEDELDEPHNNADKMKHWLYLHYCSLIEYAQGYQADNNAVFITITFDPQKFGVENDSSEERLYILHKLELAMEKCYIFQYYGCFEYQNNGTIHAHLVADITNRSHHDIRKFLKPYFTNQPRNVHAVDVQYVKSMSKTIDYINKLLVGKQWFLRRKNSIYLDR